MTLGDDASRSVSFTNIGTTATTLGDAELAGGERDDFAITSDDCSGATLAVGESCDVRVTFTPSDLGQRQAFLEIPDDTPRGSRHVMVQGDGAAPTPPTAGTLSVARGERCTDARSVKVRATGATDAVGIDRLELSNLPDDGLLSRPIDPPQRWTLTAGDGRKVVYARWWNLAGQASTVVKDAILLDTTSPETSVRRATIRAGNRVIDGRVRVRLAWGGSDATCGIAGYDVGLSRNGHAFERIADQTTATHVGQRLRQGPTYRFRVRAIDKAGNVGNWATSGSFGSSAARPIRAIEVGAALMPIAAEIRDANRAATERIRSLAGSLTDEQFRRPVGEHWTVSMVFVHLAFWDRRCLAMFDRIEQAGRDTEVDIDLVVNDLSLPIWAAVPPHDATRIAIEAAEALDARIDGYPDDLAAIVLESHPRWIRRHFHRDEHLDEAEAALDA